MQTYSVIDKDLALLLALGLDDADRCHGVERGNTQLGLGICSLLALFEECADALVLDLLGVAGASGRLLGRLGHAIGIGALAAFPAFASTLGRGVFIFHGTRTAGRHDVGLSSDALATNLVAVWLLFGSFALAEMLRVLVPEKRLDFGGNFFGGGTDKWR